MEIGFLIYIMSDGDARMVDMLVLIVQQCPIKASHTIQASQCKILS